MGTIVQIPSAEPSSERRPRGLRKLSPDLIVKARDVTTAQVIRVGLTFLGAAAFCILSLFSPDSALLGGGDKISVPFAGPVSFAGFMLLGPSLLIVLRIYLQIYVEHNDRLNRLAQSLSVARAPTLVPLRNPLIRLFGGFIFYALLPGATLFFAWKAAVFTLWGMSLYTVAVAVIASHILLPFKRFSWRPNLFLRQSLTVIAAGLMLGMFGGGLMFVVGLIPRPFYLFRADLSGRALVREDFRKANLDLANLNNSNLTLSDLSYANLRGTTLTNAHLLGTQLNFTNLSGADLTHANLIAASLVGAGLDSAKLQFADLTHSNLSDANLDSSNLVAAHLGDVDLSDASLNRANLEAADLSGADLVRTDLSGANLHAAILSGANLGRAKLEDANLSGADLSNAINLTQAQLDAACGDTKTILPKDMALKPCHANQN